MLSVGLDEDGRAKVVLGIEDSDGEDLVQETGAAAREQRKARAKARAEAAAAKEAAAKAKAKPRARGPRPIAPLNPFAAPLQIALEEDIIQQQEEEKKKRDASRSRERKQKKKQKKLAEFAEASGLTNYDPSELTEEWLRAKLKAQEKTNREAAQDMSTGGTAIGPISIASMSSGNGMVKMGICIKFLSGDCPMTAETCQQKHPPDNKERTKWIKYFNTQPCKFGNQCSLPKCIYEHPNRAGWSGENVNLQKGTTL